MWYAVYETVTGLLRSLGSTLADPLPAGLSVKEYAERPDTTTLQWDAVTRDFVTRPVVPPSLRRKDFLNRFTVAERESLKELLLNGTAVQKRRVGAFWDYLLMDNDVYLGDSYIISSVQLMESAGVIAAGRAAEVLSYG
jgi:hypothetical protein